MRSVLTTICLLLSTTALAQPIYTADMQGETFGERLQAAYDLAKTRRSERRVVWEHGWQETADTIDRPSLDGLVDEISYTVLHWSESVPDTNAKPMLRMRAGNRSRLVGAYFNGRTLVRRREVHGDAAVEIIPDLENNKNTARHIGLSYCRFDKFERGVILGDYTGPDVTNVVLSDCLFHDDRTGFEACGANVIARLRDCHWTGKQMQYAIRVIYSPPRYFDGSDKPQYVDAWGNAKPWDWTATKWWKRLTFDSHGRNGTHPDFDSSTARTWGGGPDVTCTDSEISFGANKKLKDRFAICSEGCFFELIRARIEGPGGAAIIRHSQGNPNLHGDRFHCLLQDVSTSDKTVKPIEVERVGHNAGFPLKIVRGHYANPNLPKPSEDISKGIVTWEQPMGPEGVIR